MAGFALPHAPPVVDSVSVVVEPAQTLNGPPPIAAGVLFVTVSVLEVEHPLGAVYTIFEVPVVVVAPTMPSVNPTVATAALLLVHVPPPGAPVSVVFVEIHNEDAPEMVGVAFTVTTAVGAVPQPLE